MKKIFFILAALVFAVSATAQQYPVYATPGGVIKTLPNGNPVIIATSPAGTDGQFQWNSLGTLQGVTVAGDLLATYPTGFPFTSVFTIQPAVVTNAKLALMAANTIKGNNTGAPASPNDLSPSQAKALLAIGTADVSGLGTIATQNSNNVLLTGGTANGVAVIGLPAPVNPNDAARLVDLNSASAGITLRTAVARGTVAALAANTYNNGTAGVGATLTGNSNGAISVDGGTPSVADRILVKNEATVPNNGIYVVTTVGTVGTPYVLTRATDSNTVAQLKSGYLYFVNAGSTLANSSWAIQTPPTTIGTDGIAFSQFTAATSYTANSGVQIVGTNISANPATMPTLNQSTTGNATTATTASQVADTVISTSTTLYPYLSASATGGNNAPFKATNLTFNPGTATLSVANINGSASSTVITNDTSTNATMYPVWVTGAGSSFAHEVSTTKLSFNPSTGLLTSTGFVGPIGSTPATGAFTTVTAQSVTTSGAGAGYLALGQGSAPSTGTTNVTIAAPASVTSYIRILEGAANSTGVYVGTVSGSTVTDSKVAPGATGNVLQSNGTTWVSGTGISAANTRTISQANTFALGNVVYNNNGTWTLADNSAAGTAQADGIVTATGNPFVVTTGGTETTITGLSANTVYYLGTAGALTSVAPTTVTSFVVPVLHTGVAGDGTVEIGNPASLAKINLTADVTGTLPVANGGTGITAFGTGVATALGNNTNASGGLITFNGALGTPTSGVATNLTGTAGSLTAGNATTLATSRNIGGSAFNGSADVTSFPSPGAIGGTTPAAGSFTGLTGSVTSTGSSTARTLAARGNDVTNVLDYGADPTGAADSSAAIVAAVAAVPSVNGTLYFPSGRYLWSSSSTLTIGGKTNLTIMGNGSVLYDNNNAAARPFVVVNSTNIYVRIMGMKFDGNAAGRVAGSHQLIVDAGHSIIWGNTFHNGSQFTLYIGSNNAFLTTDVLVANNLIDSTWADGIHVSDANYVQITGNSLDSTGDDGIGIVRDSLSSLSPPTQILINNNCIKRAGYGSGGVSGSSIRIDEAFDVLISNNLIDFNYQNAISVSRFLSTTTYNTRIQIENNKIINSTQHAGELAAIGLGWVAGCKVSGNKIDDPVNGGGIAFLDVNDLTITDNDFRNIPTRCIMANDSTTTNVAANWFRVDITNNHCLYSLANEAIYVVPAVGITINNVIITGNVGHTLPAGNWIAYGRVTTGRVFNNTRDGTQTVADLGGSSGVTTGNNN